MAKQYTHPGECVNLKTGFTMENLEYFCEQEGILLVQISAGAGFRGEYRWATALGVKYVRDSHPIFILNSNLSAKEKADVGLKLYSRYQMEQTSHGKHRERLAELAAQRTAERERQSAQTAANKQERKAPARKAAA